MSKKKNRNETRAMLYSMDNQYLGLFADKQALYSFLVHYSGDVSFHGTLHGEEISGEMSRAALLFTLGHKVSDDDVLDSDGVVLKGHAYKYQYTHPTTD